MSAQAPPVPAGWRSFYSSGALSRSVLEGAHPGVHRRPRAGRRTRTPERGHSQTQAGVGERMMRDGLPARGHFSAFQQAAATGRRLLPSLTGKRVMIYGQQEVVRDLIAARLAARQPLYFRSRCGVGERASKPARGRPQSALSHEWHGAHTLEVRFHRRLRWFSRRLSSERPGGHAWSRGACLSLRMARHTRGSRRRPRTNSSMPTNDERGFALLSMRSTA